MRVKAVHKGGFANFLLNNTQSKKLIGLSAQVLTERQVKMGETTTIIPIEFENIIQRDFIIIFRVEKSSISRYTPGFRILKLIDDEENKKIIKPMLGLAQGTISKFIFTKDFKHLTDY